ncbi:MAG: anaerobic ribonucleoside-triphosphate reductase activating protein [Bacillota bacterium]|nr:anaerobic ribonucleoside-triphosphate reductase activating protein [Bacillota bacterium]
MNIDNLDEKDSRIQLAGIIRESIVDGPGIRFTVFCQGCPHRCPGCHNPNTHDFNGGTSVSVNRIIEEFDKNKMASGITFSGGEPMCQPEAFAELAKLVKDRGKSITIFTGYRLEQLLAMGKSNKAILRLLALCDILIDGPFVEGEKDLTLQFRGSRNQRVIDMPRTLKERRIVPWEEN